MREKRLIITFLLLFLIASSAMAARPLITDDLPTVAFGNYEIEEGLEYSASSLVLVNSVKRGFSEYLDLGFELPVLFGSPFGAGDIAFKGKYNLNDLFSLAFYFKSASADPASGLGSGSSEYQFYGIHSRNFGGGLLHFNLGGTLIDRGAGNYLYRAAFERPLESFGALVFELTGSYDPALPFSQSPLDILLGVIKIAVDDLFILDLGIDFGLTSASPAHKAVAGLTWRIN